MMFYSGSKFEIDIVNFLSLFKYWGKLGWARLLTGENRHGGIASKMRCMT